jgi:hypothetical protein
VFSWIPLERTHPAVLTRHSPWRAHCGIGRQPVTLWNIQRHFYNSDTTTHAAPFRTSPGDLPLNGPLSWSLSCDHTFAATVFTVRVSIAGHPRQGCHIAPRLPWIHWRLLSEYSSLATSERAAPKAAWTVAKSATLQRSARYVLILHL